ncbi:MAG: SDR family oxidoreductase [Anaerolineae bacterium]
MMSAIYLVTGATGNVGAEVVRALPQNKQTRIAARDIDRARSQLGSAYDYVRFDWMDTRTFVSALAGVTHVFLVRPPAITDIAIFQPMIDEARRAGVRQIVFLSLQGIEKVSFVPHAKIEKALEASDIPYTFLRAGFFMQNLNTTHRADIVEQDEIFLPAGKSKTAFIDVRDIGAVAATVMQEDDHDNRAYVLTGSQPLDYFEVAAIFSDELGRKITYSKPSLLTFIWRMWRRQNSLMQVLLMAFLYTLTRFGQAKTVHPDTENLLGRAPITLRQFVSDHKAEFQP